ncbi:MAG: RagB/SusD family nutrient uptake outer membrane protein [Balneolaceae bacterium]|nr:RagB/SusD family nutrient uptake outer membrane protein [Balneolaceae bacterium]
MRIFKNLIFTGLLAGVLLLPACDNFVNEVDDPIDVVNSQALTTEDQVPFYMTGVKGRYDIFHDNMTVIACGLSDACVFQSEFVSDATFPTFQDIDIGEITLDNNSVDGPFTTIGQARFLADDFLSRVAEIEFSDAALKQEALYTGNLYGGLARYNYAVYFGLNENEGGGVIDAGPFIPSSEMFALASDKLQAALNNAPTEYEARVVNSLLGRIQLYQGNYDAAEPFLEAGMVEGDAPLQAEYSLESQNAWAAQAGRSRNQYTIDERFQDYIDENPQEANRIPIEVLPESELQDAGVAAGRDFYRQTKYEEPSDINIMKWQENHLMLAEIAVRDGNPATALTLINEVRASHDIDPFVGVVTMDVILEERDKELFVTGERMIDQRRTNTFHLPEGTWRYFPITQSERNQNENF